MDTIEAMKLSKREAMAIFSFLEMNYSDVLTSKFDLFNKKKESQVFFELRCLFLIVKIWERYKSEKVREMSQDCMCLFINDIYKVEDRRLSINELKFMIPFILSFRNLRTIKEMRKFKHSDASVDYFQKHFRQLAPKKEVQQSLF